MAKRLTGKEERKLLRSVGEKLKKEEVKEKKITSEKRAKGLKAIASVFKKKSGIKAERRALGKRERAVKSLLSFESITGKREKGRPTGTYKYGVPISDYKKLQSRKKALYEQYKSQDILELQRKGLSADQIRQLQLIRTVESKQTPFGVLETPESVMNVIDDELEFTKFRADKTIHPNTQAMLRNLRKTQLKAERDDVEMQRRLKERRMVADAGNILATPFIFNKHQIDITGVSENNILKAPNIFREREDNRIMTTNRFNILQTKESGNNLAF